MATRGEDPEASCNAVGKRLEEEGTHIDSCPLQHEADKPHG
jgi:hypothetical protein